MAYIRVKRPWTTQPQQLVPLDASRPLSKDLVLAYSTGRGPHDGKHGVGVVTGSVRIGAGAKGRFIQPADASSYLGFADNADYNVVGDITIIALIKTGSVSAQQGIITKCETNGGTNTPFGLFIETGGAISLNRANTGVSAFRVWGSATSLSASQTVVLAVTQVAEISTAPKFYLNGIIDSGSPTSLYSGAGVGAPTSNTTSVKFGNRTDLGTQFLGELYDGLVYKRVLSAKEIEEVSRNIWAEWQAREIEVWIPAASADCVGSASGTSTVSGIGASDNAQPGSASGTSTVSGIGASTANSVAASSGTSTVSGIGTAVIDAVGSASGTSTVDGVGTSSTGSSGSASGTSSATGVGASVAASDGVANGVATVDGIGASTHAATGSADGIATVSGVGDSVQAGSAVGNASGSSTVSGAGASVVAAVGSASGDCDVTGRGSSTGGVVESFSGGYPYISRESHAARKKKQRIELGIEEDDGQLEQFEISNLAEKSPVLMASQKQLIPARRQKKLEQEAIHAELKQLLQLEQEREEEAIIRMLMEL